MTAQTIRLKAFRGDQVLCESLASTRATAGLDIPEGALITRVEAIVGDSPLHLFLAVYASHSGMAELNNAGFVSAPDAKAARAKACELFSVAANCASAIHITPMAELQDGWSYYR